MRFRDYLAELSTPQEDVPIEPELKQNRQEHDKKIREEQDIANGAVMEAVIAEGEGDASPQNGDLVYVHVTIRSPEDDVLYSTRIDDGGCGAPLVFMIGKGHRPPRGWEIVLAGMKKGGRRGVQVKPEYGYLHPDCKMKAPEGVNPKDRLTFDLELVNWYPADDVRPYGEEGEVFKRVLREGAEWENPRPPFEVEIRCRARTVAYDGIQLTGYQYYSTKEGGSLSTTMGTGSLPPGVEECLGTMCKGESAVFVVPAETMEPKRGEEPAGAEPLLPSPPQRGPQLELELEVVGLVQVRDMTGTGDVIKRRLRQGRGEFPVDCPLHDSVVKVRCRVRPVREGGANAEWVCLQPPGSKEGEEAGGDGKPGVIEADTGCGELPEGIEMAAKLMLPGELALVSCAPSFAYKGRDDAPDGISQEDKVEFEVELVDFHKEGHWQALELQERLDLAQRMKARGNELYQQGRVKFAKARYDRLLKLVESIRDYEEEEEEEEGLKLRIACCNNLAACCLALQEYPEAVGWCDKGLGLDEKSGKLMLRKGKALAHKGDYEEAEEVLKQAQVTDAALAGDVEAALALCKKLEKAAVRKQKQQFKNFFDR